MQINIRQIEIRLNEWAAGTLIILALCGFCSVIVYTNSLHEKYELVRLCVWEHQQEWKLKEKKCL